MAKATTGTISQILGAVIDVQFEIDACKGYDVDGVRLQRVTATGLAVRIAQAA